MARVYYPSEPNFPTFQTLAKTRVDIPIDISDHELMFRKYREFLIHFLSAKTYKPRKTAFGHNAIHLFVVAFSLIAINRVVVSEKL